MTEELGRENPSRPQKVRDKGNILRTAVKVAWTGLAVWLNDSHQRWCHKQKTCGHFCHSSALGSLLSLVLLESPTSLWGTCKVHKNQQELRLVTFALCAQQVIDVGGKKNWEWNGKKESNPKDQSCLYSCFPISWGARWPVWQSAPWIPNSPPPERWDLLSAAVSLQGGIFFRWRKCLLWQWLICLTWHSPVPTSPSFSSAKSQFHHLCVRSLKKWVKATSREKIGGWVGLVENRIAQDQSSGAKPTQLPGA